MVQLHFSKAGLIFSAPNLSILHHNGAQKLDCDRMAAQNGGFSQLSSINTADTVSLGVSSVVMSISPFCVLSCTTAFLELAQLPSFSWCKALPLLSRDLLNVIHQLTHV